MQKMYKPFRIGVLFVILAAMMTLFILTLYRIQVVEAVATEDNTYPVGRIISRRVPLAAARGNIYDRNGVLLASGRASYNITINHAQLTGALDPVTNARMANDIILELVYAALEAGVPYNDTFPVTLGAPFDFLAGMSPTQRSRLDTYIDYHTRALNRDMTASELMTWMRRHYGIDMTTGIAEARIISGIRWELELRLIPPLAHLPPYIFAEDVPVEFAIMIEERGLIGVNIETGFVREYHTPYAAHLLGYVGRIPNYLVEQFVHELGYPLDAVIGRTGVELAFESYLRGVDGVKILEISTGGTVVGMEIIEEPQPGQHVYLTLDINLQAEAERALRDYIRYTNAQRFYDELDEITGGAVVVLDVRTGELLASASYPTFDPRTRVQNITMLNNDPARPLFNRALNGRYVPGSTFKMVTALAGMREGSIARWTQFNCVGVYRRLEADGFIISCHIVHAGGSGHGRRDVVQALAISCNYFFFETASRIHLGGRLAGTAMATAAADFGLGVSSGLQIEGTLGVLDSPERRDAIEGDGWWSAYTLTTAFGQGHNLFTPLQLANYTATIANQGVRNNLTLLRRVRSHNLTETLYVHTPTVANVIEEAYYISIIHAGMVEASRTGTGRSVFADFRIPTASKTGTVQREGAQMNDATFVAYAPANNPRIAVAVVIERGGSGSAIMPIARDIFDFYFTDRPTLPAPAFGELIP